MSEQFYETFNSSASKSRVNEQIIRLLASEKKLYDTQEELDRQISRINSLNNLALSTLTSTEIPDVLKAALSSLQTDFVINYGLGLMYETKSSRLIVSVSMLRGRPIDTNVVDLTQSGLDSTVLQHNIAIVIVGNANDLHDSIICFAEQCLRAVFKKPIHLENDSRVMLLSNNFESFGLRTALLCCCAPPSVIGYRERTLEKNDVSFLHLFYKHIDNFICNIIYKKRLRKFASELEAKVEERTKELQKRVEFEEIVMQIAQQLSKVQFGQIYEGLAEAIKILGLFTKVDQVSILLVPKDDTKISVVQLWGIDDALSDVSLFANLSLSNIPNIYKEILTGTVYQICNVDSLPPYWHKDVMALKKIGISAFVGIPLISQGECIGFMSLASLQAKKEKWKAGDASLFNAVGEIVVAALERQKAGEQLEWAAKYDILTKLPNRFQFEIVVENNIARDARDNLFLALLSINLDHFKSINDIYGHIIGDLLLKEVSTRIKSCVRKTDFVARVGGDEFIVLISDLKSLSSVGNIAQKIVTSLKREYFLSGHLISSIGASVGIACFPNDGTDSASLIKNADIAMYQVKVHGGNGLQFLTKDLQDKHQKHLQMENALRKAINSDEFYMVYQPQFDVQKNIVGMEALLRWNNPCNDSDSILDVIKLAEESGLIIAIDEMVLRMVFQQKKKWQEMGVFKDCRIAINLSFREFEAESLYDRVMEIIEEVGVSPTGFEIELTETVLMRNPEYSMQELSRLCAAGFIITVDDFGTGYSSLFYLKSLPLHGIKIDKGFVQNIKTKKDEIIITATIALAKQLELDVISEGVETEEQLQFLISNDCRKFQGYYFSRPLTVDQLMLLL